MTASLLSLIPFVVMGLIVLWPTARIVRKAGFSGWWSLLIFVPLANLIGFWVLASVRWPVERARIEDEFR